MLRTSRCSSSVLLLTLLLSLEHSAAAQTLVKQFPLDPFLPRLGTPLGNLVEFDGMLLFTAQDSTSGDELWRSDGTDSGTARVRDIRPGLNGSRLRYPTIAGGTFFFSADDSLHGPELWKSDGTEQGTALVRDIYPGIGGSTPNSLTSVGDLVFFVAYGATEGGNLWRSDGTAEGTFSFPNVSASEGRLVYSGGMLLFSGRGSMPGAELWASDGTIAGTRVVKNISEGRPRFSAPDLLTDVNGTLFFTASDGVSGRELWKSDGTESGTVLVKDITPGSEWSGIDDLTNVAGMLFFTARDAAGAPILWKSDGTQAGTQPIRTPYVGDPQNAFYGPTHLATLGNALFFFVTEYRPGETMAKAELWKTDGTDAGTQLVKSIRRSSVRGESGPPVRAGDRFFFAATDSLHGQELWESDGTEAGTRLVSNLAPGDEWTFFGPMASVENRLFFTTYGTRLYSHDPSSTTRTDHFRTLESGAAMLNVTSRTIRLTTDQVQTIRLSMYDALGREVALIHEGAFAERSEWPTPQNLASGVYFVRAVGEAFALTQSLVVAR